MHTATLHTKSSSNAKMAYLSANGYINELTSLYNQYIIDDKTKRLLKVGIETCNSILQKYIDNRENSYLLFCETNYDRAIGGIKELSQKSEFLLNALLFVCRSTRDRELKKLLNNSIDVLQNFIIKLRDFLDVNNSLKNFPGVIDEDSEEYDNKLAEIAECITNKHKVKTGNSIRETLGL
jgi:hypothetical protein